MNMQKIKLYKLLKDGLLSFIISFCFCVYYFIMGIKNSYLFAITISIYYFLLFIIRYLIYKYYRSGKEHNYIFTSFIFILINISIIGPITLMAMSKREFKGTIILAIIIAAYSFFKIITAVRGYFKNKYSLNKNNLFINSIKLTDALVSILTLENTLIYVNGAIQNEKMRILIIISSSIIYLLIISISIYTFYKNLILNMLIKYDDHYIF